MKRALVLAIGLVITAAVLMGAGACGEASGNTAQSPAAKQTVSADTSYDGKEVYVAAGGSVVVTLESNPSTGYQWRLADLTHAVVEKADQEFTALEAANNGEPLVGAGGKEVWTFRALDKGKSTISLEYRRPWEKDADPAETFSLTIVVE